MILPLSACTTGGGDAATEASSSSCDSSTPEKETLDTEEKETQKETVTTTVESDGRDETVQETEGDKEDEKDMEKIVNESTVIKAGNTYALIGGKRTAVFKDAEAPFIKDGKLYVSTFFLMDELDVYADSADVVKKGNLSFAPIDLAEEYDLYVLYSAEHETAIISSEPLEFGSDTEKREFARLAVNTFALAGGVSASFKGDRPVLFITDEMLESAKNGMTLGNASLTYSYNDVKNKADTALISGPNPDTGASATAYRLAACADLINAHYLAVAYRTSGDSKYLNGALSYLLAYAEPMLGTDEYLDYSAPKGDGQADIGLNIAAPLTTACEVYALIYNDVSEADKATIENWIKVEAALVIKGHEYWIENKYYDSQFGNNHLTSHLMGIVAAALVLQDDELLEYALSPEKNPACFSEMINRGILMEGDDTWVGDTDADFRNGEIYDRYRVVQNNGFGYSMYHLKFMTHTSLMLYNNGVDYFSYFGNNGENM